MKKLLILLLSILALAAFTSCNQEADTNTDAPVSSDPASEQNTVESEEKVPEVPEETEPAETKYEQYPVVLADTATEIQVKGDAVMQTHLPVFYIETEKPVNTRDYYVNGTLTAKLGDEILYGDTVSDIEIKLRGNSSLHFAKKPYKIKLAEKTDFFGYSESRHWLLLACAFDRSMMRDKIALDLSSMWFDYYTKSTWVEVYMNGKYLGLYQLCEQIRLENDRLAIYDIEDYLEEEQMDISEYTKENGYDITGGYLLEVSVQYDEKSKFKSTMMDVPIMVKYPEDAADNPRMMNYLKKYIQEFELAILADDLISNKGDHYTELFDFEDLVQYWVLSTFYKTHDFMINSTYLYKDKADENGVEDKLHMGPIWDIGNSLGNYTGLNKWVEPTEPETWRSPSDRSQNWYSEICKDPYFMVRAQEAFCELLDPVDQFVREGGIIDEYKELLAESVDMNQLLYPTFKDSAAGLPENKNFEDESEWVREFMVRRLAFMTEQLSDLKNITLPYCTFTKTCDDIAITLTDEAGTELPAGTYENKIGVKADYASDCLSPVKVEISTQLEKAVQAGIYVNDQKVGKFDLTDHSLTEVIDSAYLTPSVQARNVITVRLFDRYGDCLATNFVTLAGK